jgi:hypothetical protein
LQAVVPQHFLAALPLAEHALVSQHFFAQETKPIATKAARITIFFIIFFVLIKLKTNYLVFTGLTGAGAGALFLQETRPEANTTARAMIAIFIVEYVF